MKNRELNSEGVGLGLTISKNLAKALGGDIYASSQIGVGSSFTLKIPVTFSPVPKNISLARLEEKTIYEEFKFYTDVNSQYTVHG